MALISCPECEHSVSDKAFSCPSCGYPMNICTASGKMFSHRSICKRRKLPNGFGSIKHLSGKRSRPWAAYPPVTEFSLNGSPVLGPAIGYFRIYDEAYQALLLYNYTSDSIKESNFSLSALCTAMRSNYNCKYIHITFAELYEQYYDDKYNHSKRALSASAKYSAQAAFNNCQKLHDKKFADLRKNDLQNVIDTCPLKHSSLELIVSLFRGMYAYAMQNDIIEKDYSRFVRINIPDDDENGVPFSQEAIDLLWKNSENEIVRVILLMIYTGFRIAAYKTVQYHEGMQYFQGGVKSNASKNRIVPLHPAIQTFAKEFILKYTSGGEIFVTSKFRNYFYKTLNSLGLSTSMSGTKHTPHDCRHTFSWLCDKYGVDDLSKHLLMGHSLGNSIEKSVYGHRTFDELKIQVEKIIVPNFR